MTEYLVRWEINQEAPDAREAAEAVRATYFKLTGACIYHVQPANDPLKSRWQQVDLAVPAEDGAVFDYPHETLYRMAEKIKADGGDLDEVIEMLERPWKWSEVLTQIALDAEFDKVSPFADETDLGDD